MTAMFFAHRSIDRIVRHRQTLRACEHASAVIAPFCPRADVEAYVVACTHAERLERRYDMLINAISAFTAPALVLAVPGAGGLLAGAIFIALWIVFGLGQCMTHKAALHTDAVARATSRLCEAVTWTPEEMAARGVTLKVFNRKK